ncbi:caffeic acid 3-O-methyltransferase-like [Triticum dicoccoides]|uniref:caffeic acid 3-O-methyltransferase-like n=1 Tax=Triticum dicoccoides TaxID=85692 RepID=UPI001890F905|nr:caffeic acid 3-O-methyltransferase-like [Triticum dicoccoides]XP_044412465.1 nicotinate N-methyltransferase 1-like [Triticum aestivum]
MLRAMTSVSEPFMDVLLDGYCPGGGFEGVATLVDVGGSSGACLAMFMRRVPTIRQGVNFDLPDVVAAAPPITEPNNEKISAWGLVNKIGGGED